MDEFAQPFEVEVTTLYGMTGTGGSPLYRELGTKLVPGSAVARGGMTCG